MSDFRQTKLQDFQQKVMSLQPIIPNREKYRLHFKYFGEFLDELIAAETEEKLHGIIKAGQEAQVTAFYARFLANIAKEVNKHNLLPDHLEHLEFLCDTLGFISFSLRIESPEDHAQMDFSLTAKRA